jgi:RNA polymerase sigma factor (sigma-70 family)
MLHDSQSPSRPAPADRFATTHWSLVVSAGHGRSSEAHRALAALCENYWFPLYAFVRRAGYSADDAQDLTQEFFVRLLTQKFLAVADPRRGRFRSFLLGTMKHFLANQRRRRTAAKRGGLRPVLSLDFIAGERRYSQIEPADRLTPERLYEHRWALALLDLVLGRLREEFLAAGKLRVFDALKQFLVGSGKIKEESACLAPASSPGHESHKLAASSFPGPTYLDVAQELGMSEGAVKTAVHRLRRQYRKLLEEEIAKTIDHADSLEDELKSLLAALRLD